jgi:serine/threonine protein kinase
LGAGKTTEPTDTNIYWLEKFLGRGSFGGVFLADQTQRMATVGGKRIEINKKIAIKLMAASDAAIHEVSSALTIPEHINLVRYFDANDVVIDEERLYVLTMELADGGSLRDLLGQGALSGSETRAIAINIAEGLSHLHSTVKTDSENKRWVHLDLKPENVLKVGRIWKIADFGTAKVLDKGTMKDSRQLGTSRYMPYEFFRDAYVSTKWDVWSFGVMIVEMLTGHLPFKAKTDGELSNKIQTEHPDLKGVPTEWMEVVKGCLQKEYTRRWTADQVLTALDNIAFSASKSSTGSVSSTKVKGGGIKAGSVKPPRSNNAWWIVVVFLVLGGGGFYLWQNFKLSSPLAPIASPSSQVVDKEKQAQALFNDGIKKSSEKDYKGAMADFTESIRLNPNNGQAYFLRGSVTSILQDRQGAINDYSKAISIDPENAQAYFFRGSEKSNLGDKKGAMDDYNESIRLEPQFLAYHLRGMLKADAGDLQGAINDYSESIRLKPEPMSYFQRSQVKFKLKDTKGAMTDLDSTIRLDPNHDRAYYVRGILKNELGDRQASINDLNEAIRITPNFVDLYLFRGKMKEDLGDQQGSIADYDQAIKLKPDNPQAYVNRAIAKSRFGNTQGFISDFRKAAEIYKQQGDIEKYNSTIKLIEQLQQ